MTAFGIVVFQVCSCLGFGAFVLRILGIQKELHIQEQCTWSFAIGFGLLGWFLFFFGVVGWFSTIPLFIDLLFLASGRVVSFSYFRKHRRRMPPLHQKISTSGDGCCWLQFSS